MIQNPRKLLAALGSALVLISLATQSQELQQQKDIEVITVTSQKRVERLADVPLAVSVLHYLQIELYLSNRIVKLQ